MTRITNPPESIEMSRGISMTADGGLSMHLYEFAFGLRAGFLFCKEPSLIVDAFASKRDDAAQHETSHYDGFSHICKDGTSIWQSPVSR